MEAKNFEIYSLTIQKWDIKAGKYISKNLDARQLTEEGYVFGGITIKADEDISIITLERELDNPEGEGVVIQKKWKGMKGVERLTVGDDILETNEALHSRDLNYLATVQDESERRAYVDKFMKSDEAKKAKFYIARNYGVPLQRLEISKPERESDHPDRFVFELASPNIGEGGGAIN